MAGAAPIAGAGGLGPAPPPVAVQLALPGTADSPISLLASEPIVLATPFLQWEAQPAVGAAAPRVHLPFWRAVRFFLKRCRCGPAPADLHTNIARSKLNVLIPLVLAKLPTPPEAIFLVIDRVNNLIFFENLAANP